MEVEVASAVAVANTRSPLENVSNSGSYATMVLVVWGCVSFSTNSVHGPLNPHVRS